MSFNKPFAEQLAFFRQKLNLPTERWDDIGVAMNDRAFIVAGAQGADLLQDLRNAMDDAKANGTGLDQFRKDFAQTVAKNGWTGWTGEGTPGGVAWRTKVIYQTNMAASYAAGRWEQMHDPEMLKILPYYQFHHNDSVIHPRPVHQACDGLTLSAHDEFWNNTWPPVFNGEMAFGCHCWVSAVTKDDFMIAVANGKGPANIPAGANDITGGIGTAPGLNAKRPLLDFIDQKLLNLDAPIGAAMWQALKQVLEAEQAAAVREMVTAAAASMQPAGTSVVASVVDPAVVTSLAAQGIDLADAAIWLRDHELIHAIRDAKTAPLPLDVWLDLPKYIDTATAYLDTQNNTLVYAFDLPGVTGKVIVRVNYTDKVRVDDVRQIITSNFIATGGVIDESNLAAAQYVRLSGVP